MVGNPFIHLRAAKFALLPGEEEEMVNEGLYGKALSLYLQEGLQGMGYRVPQVCCEDWGWWVGVDDPALRMGICVYGLPAARGIPELCVCVDTKKGRRWSWKHFRFVDPTAGVEKLEADMKTLLSKDPEVEILGYPVDFPG